MPQKRNSSILDSIEQKTKIRKMDDLNLLDLPLEMLTYIGSYLTVEEFLPLLLVSKKMNEMFQQILPIQELKKLVKPIAYQSLSSNIGTVFYRRHRVDQLAETLYDTYMFHLRFEGLMFYNIPFMDIETSKLPGFFRHTILISECSALAVAKKVLQLHGAHALHFPTITFISLTQTQQFQHNLLKIKDQDLLIFVSPQAVIESIDLLKTQCTPPIAAIGKATAQQLEQHSMQDIIYPKDVWSSEGLLAMPQLQQVQQKKIMLIKGEGGRDALETTLMQRGAIVTSLVAYQRQCSVKNLDFEALVKKNLIDSIICTAGSLIYCLKTLTIDHWEKVKTIPLIVISQRLKALAEDLGFETLWVAQNASEKSLLQLLAEKKEALCQRKNNT